MRILAATTRAALWLTLLIGLPVLLLRYGSPLPDHIPHGEDWRALIEIPDGPRLADLIVILAWLTWVTLLAVAIRAIVRATRTTQRRPAPARWRAPNPLRTVAALLLGTAATTTAMASAATTPVSAGPIPLPPAPSDTEHPPSVDAGVHRVRSGETLWSIATDRLGDPGRWREIWDLNRGRVQTDGRRFDDPDLIRPGWHLDLPGNPEAPQDPETPSPEPPTSSSPAPATPDTTPPATSDSNPPVATAEHGGFRLPSGAWIGAGLATAFTAALLLIRARRRHATASGHPVPVSPPRPGAASIIDAAEEARLSPAPEPTDVTSLTQVQAHAVVALLGPGGPAAARHLLAEHLTDGHALTDRPTWTALTGDDTTPAPSNLHVTDTLTTALQHEVLARTRALDDGHAPTPLLLVTTDATGLDATTLNGLHITTITLTPAPNAETYLLDDDGRDQERHTRFHHLTATDLTTIIATLTDTAPPPATEATDAPQETPEPETHQPPAEAAPATALAELHAFGPPHITIAGTPLTGLRTKTLELLLHLATGHPRGTHKDTLTEALLPDTAMTKAPNHLRTLIANARATLREATGHPDEQFLHTTGDHYRLDTHAITVDIHQYDEHLRHARTSDDPAQELIHLTAASSLYTGDFAEGKDAEWTEPVREHYRRQHTGTLTRLADLHHAQRRTGQAITILEDACRQFPLDEPLHQKAIALALSAKRPDRALVLFRALKKALGEIGEHPKQDTYGLFNEPPG